MVLLPIGACWLLVIWLVLGVCAAARDGDLRQESSRSAAMRQPGKTRTQQLVEKTAEEPACRQLQQRATAAPSTDIAAGRA